MVKFRIIISLPKEDLEGIHALDEARRLKLPDTNDLRFHDTMCSAYFGEEFARAHFPCDVNTVDRVISNRLLLCPGDLIRTNTESESYVKASWNPDMPPERVAELWFKGEEV